LVVTASLFCQVANTHIFHRRLTGEASEVEQDPIARLAQVLAELNIMFTGLLPSRYHNVALHTPVQTFKE
jgi:hypothetical protein